MRGTSTVGGGTTPTPEGLLAKMTAEIWLDARIEARFRQEPDKVLAEFKARHGVTSDIRVPSFDELEKSPVPLNAITWEELYDKPYTSQQAGCGTFNCGETVGPNCGAFTLSDSMCKTVGCTERGTCPGTWDCQDTVACATKSCPI